MERRSFLKRCGAIAAGLALTSGSASPGIKLANNSIQKIIGRRRPNVIYIMADDLGYADIGCYGQKKIETPAINQLAAEGMTFSQHYTGNCVCAPSRCNLMTGLHPGHAYVRGNLEINLSTDPESNGYQMPMPADTVTVGHVFQQAGYKTGCMGKWGSGGPNSTSTPAAMGFHHFYGFLGQVQAHNYYYPTLWKDTEDTKLTLIENPGYSHDHMTEEALTFIRKYKDSPFFLYLPYCIPHSAYQVPELAQYENKSGWTSTQKKYAAMVSRMDSDIGKIMQLIKTLDLDDNTLIMFCSDNGVSNTGLRDFFKSNDLPDGSGTLRNRKGYLYEGGLRTPLVARWPGKIKPGTKTDHISAFWDFLPTCCDLAGVKTPKVMWSTGTWRNGPENKFKELIPDQNSWHDPDGISYLPTLLGKDFLQKKHDYLYWELKDAHQNTDAQRAQAIRKGKWKLIRKNLLLSPPNRVVELYDLANDIGEQNNLANSNHAKRDELLNLLENARVCNPNFILINDESC